MNCFIRLGKNMPSARHHLAVAFFITFLFSSFVFAQETNLSNVQVKEKIHVTADSLSSDSDSKSAEFVGNVKATQGDFLIKSDRLKIFYRESPDSKAAPGTAESIDRIVATGNVEIKSEDAVGLTDRAEYDTKTMIVVLTGENSKVFDQKNSVTGSRITIYRNDGRVKVEGDKNRKVNAVLFPNEKTPLKESSRKKEKEGKTPVVQAMTDKPAHAAPLVLPKEGKPPVIQAKAGTIHPEAPVSVVYAPAAKEKAKPKIASGVKAAPGSLRKSMGIAVFDNRTSYTLAGFQESLGNGIAGSLQGNCSGLILLKSGDDNYPPGFEMLPRLSSGSPDSFKLCETGRALGLTAIMTGLITDIKIVDELKGILLWKDNYPALSMTVHIDILDTETGTKILGESFTHKKYSDDIEVETVKSGKIDPAFVKEAFEQITKEAGKKICETMGKELWKGYVSSVSGDKITISSGRGMGVSEGKAFDVFGSSMIVGMQGQRFFVPGPKIGEVRITGVYDDSSEALTVSGGSFREGYTVKAK